MSDIVIYDDGSVELNTTVENETIWLSQKQISIDEAKGFVDIVSNYAKRYNHKTNYEYFI